MNKSIENLLSWNGFLSQEITADLSDVLRSLPIEKHHQNVLFKRQMKLTVHSNCTQSFQKLLAENFFRMTQQEPKMSVCEKGNERVRKTASKGSKKQ